MSELRDSMGARRRAQIDAAMASYHCDRRRHRYTDWDNDALLKARETMSLRQMARHFGRDAETIRQQLKRISAA
jgi:hypothetical protein